MHIHLKLLQYSEFIHYVTNLVYNLLFFPQVVTLEEFFGEEDVFFVYGNERLSADDFELEFEGKLLGCYITLCCIITCYIVFGNWHSGECNVRSTICIK